MPADKARLYVALYARSAPPKMPCEEDQYHWSFQLTPKDDKHHRAVRIHAKNEPGKTAWMFEARETSTTPTNMILIRVLVGKVLDTDRLMEILKSVPIRNNEPGFNCVTWLEAGLAALQESKSVMGTSTLDWELVRDACMGYCQRKRAQHRFETGTKFDTSRVPTYDLLQQKETVP